MRTILPESVGLSAARLRRIDRAMQAYVDRGQLAGLITVLARRGQVAHLGIYGQSDLSRQAAMQEDAIFRIFSMTKPITCLAVLMLYEEGAFHLQHPVSAFIPAFQDLKVFLRETESGLETGPLARPVTIYDLLTHTSGLGYGLDGDTPVNRLYQEAAMLRCDETLAEKTSRVARMPLLHQPGLRYTYSIGIDILGRIIEIVSGLALDDFFQQRIFEPLGMVDTGFFVPPEKLPRLATLYTANPPVGLVDVASLPGDPTQFPFGQWTDKRARPPFLSGGGGLVSTTADYLRFAMLLHNQGKLDGVRLLSRKTVALMTAAHLQPDQFFVSGVSSGLGVLVMTDPARAQMLGSAGAYGGSGAAQTEFWVDPQEDMVGLLMTQYIHASPIAVGMDFRVLSEQAIED